MPRPDLPTGSYPKDAAAPIIVTAEMGAADLAWADGLRRALFPPERNQLVAHITLFHHLPPTVEAELKAMLAELVRQAKPPARIEGVVSLGRGVAVHLSSPGIETMRAQIADRFLSLLTPQDQATPRLHVTVQNKVAPDIAKATLLKLRSSITPRPFDIHGLACWHYRGGPWSLIARYAFRG